RRRHHLLTFDPIDDDGDAFAEMAALIAELPLVLTVDTAIAHLAGALDIPTLVGLSVHSDWRWQLGRSDSAWYPSMRLVRQERLDDWSPVFAQMVGFAASRISALATVATD